MAISVSTEERADLARIFDPLKIGQLEIRNRLAVAPMTRSARQRSADNG